MQKSLTEFLNAFTNLPEYTIEIGVISLKSKRKTKVLVGITNAELMFIHEHGSPINNVPARPVLQMTIDYANKNLLDKYIDKAVDAFVKSDGNEKAVRNEFEKMCIIMENYAREIIYSNDGRLAPNAPSTIRKKGDNHPLFDTGQLARSITCKLIST